MATQPVPILNISNGIEHQQQLPLAVQKQQWQQLQTPQGSTCDRPPSATVHVLSRRTACKQSKAPATAGGAANAVCSQQMQMLCHQQDIGCSLNTDSVWNTVHGYNLAAVPGVLQSSRWYGWQGNAAAAPAGSTGQGDDGREGSDSSYDSCSSCNMPGAANQAADRIPAAAVAPAAAADNMHGCCCNEELLFGEDNGQHVGTLDAQTHMLASLITSSSQFKKGEQHEHNIKLHSRHDATAHTAVAGKDINDDADGNGNHCAVTRHVADNHCSSNSMPAKLLGLQPLMRLAVPLVQHPTVFMEGSNPPAELQGLLCTCAAPHATPGGNRKEKRNVCKEMTIATAAGAANSGASQALVKQAAVAPNAARQARAVSSAPVNMQRKKTKNNKNKQQKKVSPILANTAAIPGRGGTISSETRHRHHKTEQPVYTSVLELLKNTTRDPAVLMELNTAEAHDMRQAAAMRKWMSVGSGMTGSTVVAAALRAAAAAAGKQNGESSCFQPDRANNSKVSMHD
jgi:hypothetical protein